MYALLYRLGTWLAQKLAVAVLIVALGLAAYGVWLFLQEHGSFDTRRADTIRVLAEERDRLVAAKDQVEQRLSALRTDIQAQQQRVKQAEKIVATLRDLESWWERWFGNPEQQKANAEQARRMEQLKAESTGRIVELQRAVAQATWEKDGLDVAIGRAERDLAAAETSQSPAAHYLQEAWRKSRWFILLALASYFFGPTLWSLTMYYGFAWLATRGRPIKLVESVGAVPEVSPSHVSVEATLWPGDVLRVKEKFLQASDEGVRKATRFVLDWRIPLTSVACGLTELVELTNSQAGETYTITLSNAVDPHVELAIVSVPEGGSLVLRPSFLAGVIQRGDAPLVIRRRWQLLRWQSWITGQFRFFEFVGPCRLVVAGSRGVRAERLVEREGQREAARRTNQDATIGFTPNLKYRPVRAETFWAYYRGMNPLFDDLFAGAGLFLLQETATADSAARAGRFWSSLWNGVLKVFGL